MTNCLFGVLAVDNGNGSMTIRMAGDVPKDKLSTAEWEGRTVLFKHASSESHIQELAPTILGMDSNALFKDESNSLSRMLAQAQTRSFRSYTGVMNAGPHTHVGAQSSVAAVNITVSDELRPSVTVPKSSEVNEIHLIAPGATSSDGCTYLPGVVISGPMDETTQHLLKRLGVDPQAKPQPRAFYDLSVAGGGKVTGNIVFNQCAGAVGFKDGTQHEGFVVYRP
ncbi:MAG: hypothetical protein KDK78_01890 [Chlamydiia bacterium]|nr:hypothetical protein [Chlamydiia bacterium]